MLAQGLVDAKRQELTTALMKPLPLLLRKYLPDADIVQHLVDIIHHLDLELFSIKRQEAVSLRCSVDGESYPSFIMVDGR